MRVLCIYVLLVLHASSAFGWGSEGHRITGYIANTALTDNTRTKLQALLGDDNLATFATWMDDEREQLDRQFPGSSHWHYENRAACSPAPTKANCPRGQCITRQIERLRKQLKEPSTTHEQRAIAVRMLIHLFGDLHQPLHLIDNDDRGGNDVLVFVGADHNPRRLHEAWDTQFLRMNLHRRDEKIFAQQLLHDFSFKTSQWQRGDVSEWANETHAIGKQVAYSTLPNFTCGMHSSNAIRLPDEYIKRARPIINEQLTKAGLRIAMVLNDIFD